MTNKKAILILLGTIVLIVGGFYAIYKMLTYVSPAEIQQVQETAQPPAPANSDQGKG